MRKRTIYLVIISTISLLSTYQFIDVYSKFKFLFVDILNNITQSVVIYLIFNFLISITSYVAIKYNWKFLQKNLQNSDADLIDESETPKIKEIGWMYYIYLLFSILIIGLGVFLILKPLQENYPIGKLPNGIIAYFIVLIIIGLGIILLNDGIKIKRDITSFQAPPS